MPSYLADSSIWGWADGGRRPDIRERLAERLERDEVVTCTPIVMEILHRARNAHEYDDNLVHLYHPLRWLAVDGRTVEHAFATQRAMARGTQGNHRRPAIDYIIAAVAELASNGVVLWGFDRDLRAICEHTGQPHEIETAH